MVYHPKSFPNNRLLIHKSSFRPPSRPLLPAPVSAYFGLERCAKPEPGWHGPMINDITFSGFVHLDVLSVFRCRPLIDKLRPRKGREKKILTKLCWFGSAIGRAIAIGAIYHFVYPSYPVSSIHPPRWMRSCHGLTNISTDMADISVYEYETFPLLNLIDSAGMIEMGMGRYFPNLVGFGWILQMLKIRCWYKGFLANGSPMNHIIL